MQKNMLRCSFILLMSLSLCACDADSATTQDILPDNIMDTYYDADKDKAFTYIQKRKIQKFMTMWVEEGTHITDPIWDFDTLTRIEILDHDLQVLHPDEALYSLTFSDGGKRYGYIIVQYHEDGPALSNWSVKETTPIVYDLKANETTIAKTLSSSGIDMDSITARRVYLLDTDTKQTDQIILFTDATDAHYICYLNDPPFTIKKWQ